MELRELRAEEIEEVVSHLDLVFDDAPREMFEAAYMRDSAFDPSQVQVVIEDGKIVASVLCSPRHIRIGGTQVLMGAIGGVSTHPDYQRRGFSSALLRAQIVRMEEHGYHMSMLFTGLTRFYQRLGWEPFPTYSRSTVSLPDQLPESRPSAYHVRPWVEEADMPGMMACYDDYNATRTLTEVRSPQYWRDRQAGRHRWSPSLVAERDGQICAYLSGSSRRIHEAGCRHGHLAAFVPLAEAMLREAIEAKHETISCALPFSHPVLEHIRNCGPSCATHTMTEAMMLRVISLQALLQQLAPEFSRRLEQADFACRQPLAITLKQMDQSATVHAHNQQVSVSDQPGDVELPLTGRQFFLLLCGAATIDQLAEVLQVSGVRLPEPHLRLLRVLFPPQEPFYWSADRF